MLSDQDIFVTLFLLILFDFIFHRTWHSMLVLMAPLLARLKLSWVE